MNAAAKNAFWALAVVCVLIAVAQVTRQLGTHEEVSWSMPIIFFCFGLGLGGWGCYLDYFLGQDSDSHSGDDSDHPHDQNDDFQGSSAISSDE